ncbi:MAG: hypothetical protein IJB78_04700 [Oscillospiraceae bacterium]|nr:hypothetical protein [Oscillospiraceae bacterium]
MKNDKMRFVFSIIWLVLGLILVGLAFAGYVDDFWSGMGSALVVIGALQLLRRHRFNKNEKYREKVNIEENDERNHFLRSKAWAWTGYIFVLSVAVLSIVLRILEQDMLSSAASMAVCYMLIIFWISYAVLKRKY